MNFPLKAVVVGVAIAALIVFCHLLFPVLLVLLMLGLVRRVWFGSRWDASFDGYGYGHRRSHRHGHGWGAMHRNGSTARGWHDLPTIDGNPWLRSGANSAPLRGDAI